MEMCTKFAKAHEILQMIDRATWALENCAFLYILNSEFMEHVFPIDDLVNC